MTTYEFSGEVWIWDARPEETWTFVSVPTEVSEEIAELAAMRPRAGFGAVRVAVTIGGSSWRTSVFPAADGRYALPVKKAVRRAESIGPGDTVAVALELVVD